MTKIKQAGVPGRLVRSRGAPADAGGSRGETRPARFCPKRPSAVNGACSAAFSGSWGAAGAPAPPAESPGRVCAELGGRNAADALSMLPHLAFSVSHAVLQPAQLLRVGRRASPASAQGIPSYFPLIRFMTIKIWFMTIAVPTVQQTCGPAVGRNRSLLGCQQHPRHPAGRCRLPLGRARSGTSPRLSRFGVITASFISG